MTTALVLGAGGLTGQAFHLGVLTALAEGTGFDALDALYTKKVEPGCGETLLDAGTESRVSTC